jgi:hypothetical protein
VSVADRGVPLASCSEWHGDGTAGEDDRASHLAAVAPARAMGEARPGRLQPRWQAPVGARQLLSLTGEMHAGPLGPGGRTRFLPPGGGRAWLGGSGLMLHLGLEVIVAEQVIDGNRAIRARPGSP